MAERRLPFIVQDDDGSPRQGEVLIVRGWPPDPDIKTNGAFTIILAQRPFSAGSLPPQAANVAVCAPATPVRLPAAVAEAAAVYGTDDPPSTPPLRLSRHILAAYASGSMLAAQPLFVTLPELFSDGAGYPRLQALARELIAAAGQAETYWRALAESLSLPHPPPQAVQQERLRARLRTALRRAPSVAPGAPGGEASAPQNVIAAGAPPETVASSPAALADDVALVRCLAEQSEATAELAAMRAYLSGAVPGSRIRTLLVDHAVTREQLSFVTLLSGPHQLEAMRAAFETFRTRYAAAYVEHHQRYWRACAHLHTTLDETAPTAQTLARLNTLQALGRPVGRGALATYERLTRRQRFCTSDDLKSTLREQPSCPDCNVTLEGSAPSEEAEEALRRLRAALARQQARLASETVCRILARGGQRIDQFLQIVQASDLAGLAQVLDDKLLAFLRELLSEPFAPTPDALDLFETLARAYPVVSEEQVDAVIETLRQLLVEKLASQRKTEPGRAAAIHLASVPPPAP